MDSATLQAILDELWPDLPDLLGDAWPDLEPKLLEYRRLLSAREARALCRPSIRRPRTHLHFRCPSAPHGAECRIRDRPLPRGIEKGTTYAKPSQRPAPQAAAESAGDITRYTDIACPRRIWRGHTAVLRGRASYDVCTRTQRCNGGAGGLNEGPIQVQLTAPRFDILNDARQETEVLAEKDSPPVVFDLKPQEAGHRQLQFDFFQNGQPVRTATAPIEVTTYQVAEEGTEHIEYGLPFSTAAPPDLVLHIGWNADDRQLEFTLIRDGGTFWRSFQPVALETEPAAQAIELYRHITSLADLEDPTLANMLGKQLTIPGDDVDHQVRNLGFHLWRTLLPEEFRTFYAAERDHSAARPPHLRRRTPPALGTHLALRRRRRRVVREAPGVSPPR